MSISRRVSKNLTYAPTFEKDDDRESARLLFSTLAHLEQIAVEAALKGAGIKDQYEDEVVHRDTFQAIAERFGYIEPASYPVLELLEFLRSLKGNMSLALLNIVCESWLDNVFKHLSTFGFADKLFTIVEEEEARHAEEAKQLVKPDPEAAEPLVKELERLLFEVSRDPHFVVPLMYFGGSNAAAKLGIDACKSHRVACSHLQVEPSSEIEDMEATCKAVDAVPPPRELEKLDAWREFALTMFDAPGPMNHQFEVAWDRPYAQFEAELVRVISMVLMRQPDMNRTITQGKLYAPTAPMLGIRRVYDALGKVFTVFIENAQRMDWPDVARTIEERSHKIRRQPYCALTEVRRFKKLLPPARHAVTLTHVGAYGCDEGFAPLVPDEGATISIATGKLRYRPKPLARWFPWLVKWKPYVRVSVTMDHRAFDGKDIAKFSNLVKKELNAPQA